MVCGGVVCQGAAGAGEIVQGCTGIGSMGLRYSCTEVGKLQGYGNHRGTYVKGGRVGVVRLRLFSTLGCGPY